MSIIGRLRRLWYLVRRDTATAELEEEMRLHMELRAEKLREGGDAHADAEARRRFGNVTAVTEASRDAWGGVSLDELKQDVRHAFRRLHQRPALSIPVLAVLALGIGATTAVFSAVDAAMIRSLPFPRAHELFVLSEVDLPSSFYEAPAAGRSLMISDVAAMPDVFSHVAVFASGGLNLSDPERPQRVNAGVVSASFFGTIGVRPLHGRTFSSAEGQPNGHRVVVLSHGLWQRQFGGDEVLGKNVTLHGRSHEIVGIMPAGFSFPGSSDLWIPMTIPITPATFEPFRGFLPSSVLGRAQRGVTADAVSARLLARWEQVIAPATGEYRENLNEVMVGIRQKGAAVPLQRQLLGDRRRALVLLLGATGFLLLIACANVANLLLSDAANRRREIAVREVLGATSGRITRQLLVESLLLSLAGTAVGLLLAPGALRVLRATLPAPLAGVAPAQVDLRVLAFAALIALVTSLLFGMWPAFDAARADAAAAIKSGGGHGSTAGKMGRVRAGLVAVEVALTVVLLVGAGLMLRSFDRLMSKETGMIPDQVATMETTFGASTSAEEERRVLQAVLERLSGQPDIDAVGVVNDLPLRGGGGMLLTVAVPGAPALKPGDYQMARALFATGGYFPAMGIQLLRGRLFTDADVTGPRVAIVSATMADKYWPGVDPVGRYFTYRGDTTRMTVVGVVSDVRERALHLDPPAQMYRPILSIGVTNAAIVARGSLPPSIFLARLTAAMRQVLPTQAVYNVRMMDQVVTASVTPRRTNTVLFALFAGLALLISALGVYAVLAFGVAKRSREFGIRAALGANATDIVRLVSREMIWLLAIGIGVGLAGALALSRVLGALLYEVDARDPVTFLTVPLVLLVPALLATLVPVIRAVRVNPTTILREE